MTDDQIKLAAKVWICGEDTVEMSRRLGLPESTVVRNIARIKAAARRIRDEHRALVNMGRRFA